MKIKILLLALFFSLATVASFAQETDDKTKQIEDLKERLATKVAELSQTQKRALYGTVKDITISTLTVETSTKDIKIELIEDISIFQVLKGKRTELTSSDLTKGDVVTVFGAYDQTLDLLKAAVVFIQGAIPTRVAGTVTEIDRTKFTAVVKPKEGADVTIDIERTTKTTLWDGKSLVKGGFSRMAVGDSVHVVGTPVAKTENRISAARILDLGNLAQ